MSAELFFGEEKLGDVEIVSYIPGEETFTETKLLFGNTHRQSNGKQPGYVAFIGSPVLKNQLEGPRLNNLSLTIDGQRHVFSPRHITNGSNGSFETHVTGVVLDD